VQGQGFRDRSPEFAAEGAVILGASFDTVEDNRAFAEAQQFGYQLLSDVTREVGTAYGVTKDPSEQWADFPKRITFLIDPEGVVRKVYAVTDVARNPDEVLDDIRQLTAV
jgi:thioredoxin-dependent peroxiredoxin